MSRVHGNFYCLLVSLNGLLFSFHERNIVFFFTIRKTLKYGLAESSHDFKETGTAFFLTPIISLSSVHRDFGQGESRNL